jgi:nicotinamide-nucleotide amidase
MNTKDSNIYGRCSASIARLCKEIGALLSNTGSTIALAESCTGGLISGAITEIPGSSEYFGYGVVSYSNEAKMKLLGVKEVTLEQFGAVSPQTAVEMAEGVRRLASADYGLSVTGIAGPGGATETKPVGLVYVGFSSLAGSVWCELRLNGTRQDIRQATVEAALSFVLESIKR